jgi:hypothetical protein
MLEGTTPQLFCQNCFLLNEHVKKLFTEIMAKISKKGKKKEAKVAEPTSDDENLPPLPATRSSDEAIPRKVSAGSGCLNIMLEFFHLKCIKLSGKVDQPTKSAGDINTRPQLPFPALDERHQNAVAAPSCRTKNGTVENPVDIGRDW